MTDCRRHSSRSSTFERCTSTTGTSNGSSASWIDQRVVRPRGRVDDHAVGPVVRVVAPLDVLALAVRLAALHASSCELAGPLVDRGSRARPSTGRRRSAGSRRPSMLRLTPLRTMMRTRRCYPAISASSSRARPRRELRRPTPGRRRRAGRGGARRRRLLVALHRLPRALAVDAHAASGGGSPRTWPMSRPDRRSAASRPSATALAVRHALVAGGRLERVRERVAEVEHLALGARRAGRGGRPPP